MYPDKKWIFLAFKIVAALLLIIIIYYAVFSRHSLKPTPTTKLPNSVELNDVQLKSIQIAVAKQHAFRIQRDAFGSIDFDGDMSLQIFPPYQGKIIQAFVQIGDDVKKGQALFTIDSPDLIQAESTLITTAGVLEFTKKTWARDKQLYRTQGVAQREFEQAISDQQTAEGAFKAAIDAVRIFGKTKAEIDTIISTRQIDPVLVVFSPITGRITQRNAVPGQLVQPGTAPAPYSIADISTLLMIANVPETDSPLLRIGQKVKASIAAYPNHLFDGKISTISASVDPNLHTVLIRSKIADPKHELRPGMLANLVIIIGSRLSTAVLPDSVVREGDGAMTVWVAIDKKHFIQRKIKMGIQQDGYVEILSGVKPGERIVSEGAIFLDNMLNTDSAG